MSDPHIPLSVPSIQGNEWKYVKECLDTEWVSSAGEYVNTFEKRISRYTGARHAVVNGTAALHLSLIVAGVTAGDEVIVPTLTFIAPVNAASYVGARPVFMDCDEFYNVDAAKTIAFIESKTAFRNGYTYNSESGRRIMAIVPVHIFGNAVRMEDLVALCRDRNIRVIEDATESLGTYYTQGSLEGRHTGTIGDIGCYSFNGNKIITTGGGGMVVTDNDDYAERVRYLSTQAKDDGIRYVHGDIGYNYRLTNVQAALGVAQLENLPEFIRKKKSNYAAFKREIDEIEGLCLADVPDYADQNHWFYAARIDKKAYGLSRDELMDRLAARHIQARPVWELNHRQKMYREHTAYRIEKAIELWETTLNIPCSVNLTADAIHRVLRALKDRG